MGKANELGIFIPNEYHTSHLPKCLIFIYYKHPFFQFKINSIISGGKPVRFGVHYSGEDVVYVAEIRMGYYFKQFSFSPNNNWEDDMVKLNLLTHYVYAYHDAFDLHMEPTQDVLDKYKIILKNKMIHNLIKLYLQKFMYLIRDNYILSIVEIKIIIVEILIKLDKWFDLVSS